ncbi:methyl-accepting chemotaxis protein [Natranaerobius trueperi]|uniref:Chemotaxis protein n=1 Tax=Natranaerobius trueperi TaxID=759412 RepID=A0A226BYR3_9FIRM|nr:HAMP domain-containing methyl-accepting chemotaxis protein [Natranaerobius trueperi]OWZ83339.1 chemotaxis protein [Natranaerobius trueperi]
MRNKSSIKLKLIIIPLLITFVAIAGIGGVSSYYIRESLFEQMRENGFELSHRIISQMEDNEESINVINDMIEDTIRTASRNVISNHENLSNEVVKQIAEDSELTELNVFNEDGEIIYSSIEEYVGWEPPEDHVLNEFIESNDDELMEDIRQDTESDEYIKYGYLINPEGGFVQAGVSANQVEELQDSFDIQNTVNDLVEENNIVFALFTSKDLKIEAHSNEDRIGMEVDDEGLKQAAVHKEHFTDEYYYEPEDVDVYDVIVPVEIDGEHVGALNIGYSMEEVQGAVYENLLRVGIIGLVTFLILSLILYRSSNYVVTTLGKLRDHLNKLSSGNFADNLTDKELTLKDELGEISKSIDTMQNSVVEMIRDIHYKSEQVASSSQELSATSEESTQSANEVAKTIEEIANGASTQAQDTDEGVKEINDLGNYIQKNHTDVENLNNTAGKVDTLKDEGLTIVEDLVNKTEHLNTRTTEVNDIILNTKNSAEQITEASEMIKNISEQTNLLALNAAIEAARAGEAGQGFSVVADEIRKLAEESSKFTEEIDSIIKDLLEKSNYAVTTMEEVKEIVDSEKESVEQTSTKFSGIKDAIEQVKEVLQDVNDSGKEMEEKKDKIISVMENLSSISEENAAGTEEASASVEEQTAAMEDISRASDSLAKLSEEMKTSIDKFKYE